MKEIKVYIKSERNHLMEAMVGFEKKKLFTGIIFLFDSLNFVENNNLLSIEDPITQLQKIKKWQPILKKFKKIQKSDKISFKKKNFESSDIYILFFKDMKSLIYLSQSNKGKGIFRNSPKDILRPNIVSPKTFVTSFQSDLDLHISLLRLEKLALIASDLGGKEQFDSFVHNYGFDFIH